MNDERRARSDRTPMTDAGDVIGAISEIYLALNPGKTIRDFTNLLDPYFVELLVDGDSIIDSWNESDFPENFPIQMHIALAFCGQAARAHWGGEEQRAWTYAFDASVYLGKTLILLHDKYLRLLSNSASFALSENARKAAIAGHAGSRETYSIKKQISDWFVDNHSKFKSLDKAAEAALGVAPISFKTARKYIGEAKKAIPSARKT